MKELPLTNGKVALLDDEDYEKASKFKWYELKSKNSASYAYGSKNDGIWSIHVFLHHLVLNYKPPSRKEVIDHINGNGLDCQKNNLRKLTAGQNHFNTTKTRGASRFRGVARHHDGWQVTISINNRREWLGNFDNNEEEAAARVYDARAKQLLGPFANLNFPGE